MRNTANRSKRKAGSIPLRLNLLFGIVVLLFTMLIARLAHMQIVNKDFYESKLARASQKTISIGSVRGEIYDAKGTPLVANEVLQVASFTRSNTMTAQAIKEVARELSQFVTVSDVSVSDRDKADYFLADTEVYRQVVDQLPKKERYDSDGNYLPESTIYNNAAASLKPEQLAFSEDELKIIELFTQMNAAGYFETVNLVTDPLSAEQIAKIAADEKNLSGISTASNWKRTVLPTSLASIIGTVTTEQAGLPEEDAATYLAKGYSPNDRVGTAYLEKQYEDILQGKHTKKEINLDRNGNVDSIETVQEGTKGNNIKLTIDLAFQDGVNGILKRHFDNELAIGSANYSDGVYAVVLNPKTGAVLAMAGYKHDLQTGEVRENSLGTVMDTFVPGSIVKAATITAGWEHGVLSGNQIQTDQPIQLADSAPIKSWYSVYGNRDISAVQALQFSSNTYMVQIALNMLGEPYTPGMLVNDGDVLTQSMANLRSTFGEYGLGSATGIDLPLESTGYLPEEYSAANYLTNSFGQFDNYTPMQMAQYAATIANRGVRISPRLVQGIYGNNEAGGMGELIETVSAKEMNRVNVPAENIDILREGFYMVVHGGDSLTTGHGIGAGVPVSVSAKTGTAETVVQTETGQIVEAINTNIVAYAPSEDPQIAVAVVLPKLTNLRSTTSKTIMTEIIGLYHSLNPMN